MQGWFNVQKSSRVTYHINGIKKKNTIDYKKKKKNSIDTKKAWALQNPVAIADRNSQLCGYKKDFLNLIKDMYV